jgi:hypothetical protein
MENLDRLILKMHPDHPRKDRKVKVEVSDKKGEFRGLAIPDQARDWDAEEEEARTMKLGVKDMDDTLDQFIGLEKVVKSQKRAKRERSASPNRDRGSRRGSDYPEKRRSEISG